LEKDRDSLQVKYNESVAEVARVRAQQKIQQQQLTDRRFRAEKIISEQIEINEQIKKLSVDNANWEKKANSNELLAKEAQKEKEETA